MEGSHGVSAWELRRYFSRQVRRLRFLYKALIVLCCLIFLSIAAHVIYYYNHLTSLECQVLTAHGKVGATLQYRANLIPVLVHSVASFVEHEESVFYRTVDARERELSMGQPPGDPEQTANALEELEGQLPQKGGSFQEALQRIMAIAEQYPALVTSEVYQLFMKQVTEAEAAIRDARNEYNDTVNAYSSAAMMFPGNLYAACFGFEEFRYFEEISESEWEQVQIGPVASAAHAAAPATGRTAVPAASSSAAPAGGEDPDGQE